MFSSIAPSGLCFSTARAGRVVCGQSLLMDTLGFPRPSIMSITLLQHSPWGGRLVGQFLEVESLGFCKEKVPLRAAALELPLFSKGRGTPGERDHMGP